MDYVTLKPKLNCKQCRSVTVSDQKGLITRGKNKHQGCTAEQRLFVSSVSPLRTQDAFTCNVTRLPLFLTSASVAAGVEEGRVGAWRLEGLVGFWQWPNGGTSDTASASPLHDCVPARQHAAICWIPPRRHHHTPDPPPTTPSGCCYNH